MPATIRVTWVRSAGPVPYPTYEDPGLAIFLDPPTARARPVPARATSEVREYEPFEEVDGTLAAPGCIEVAEPPVELPVGHKAFCGATRYRSAAGHEIVVSRWRSWPERRALGPKGHHLPGLDHSRFQREDWNARADEYQEEHAFDVSAARRWTFGPFVGDFDGRAALGDLSGKRVLELGTGGGQLGGDLHAEGVDVVGLDQSRGQLRHAKGLLPVVEADAQAIPIRTASVDLVFCAFGAIGGFTDIRWTLAEVARVVRPGGRAVWAWTGPVFNTMGDDFGSLVPERSYFDRTPWSGEEAEYPLTYGDWVEAIVGAGLRIDALHEPAADEEQWVESSWPWWSRERTTMLPTMVVWEVTRP